jgi:hypothetical protein
MQGLLSAQFHLVAVADRAVNDRRQDTHEFFGLGYKGIESGVQ